jgi:hypothetical protein
VARADHLPPTLRAAEAIGAATQFLAFGGDRQAFAGAINLRCLEGIELETNSQPGADEQACGTM